jgi:hypothetical protein
MYPFDTIYLYDQNDRQYEAQIREITLRAIGVRSSDRSKTTCQILCTIMRPVFNGDRQVEIRDNEVMRTGWQWSCRPVPPIRKDAIVVIENWDRQLEARVHGYVQGIGGAHGHSFAFEGIRALPRKERGLGSDLGRIKGHHFTASTDCVKKILKNGKGRRLLLCDFMPEKEQRAFFKF